MSTAARPRPGGLPPAATKWTGGDSGIAWGAGDVWMEPFDMEGVQATLEILYRHWMPKKRAVVRGAGGGGGGGSGRPPSPPAAGSDTEDERFWSEDEDGGGGGGGGGGGAPRRLNTVCEHVACSARPFCVVATLCEANDLLYSKTGSATDGTGFFKGRALRLGTDALAACTRPLRTRADVDALTTAGRGRSATGLGPKTCDKIWEVLSSGQLGRLQEARADPVRVATKELSSVWGVGEKTAAKWAFLGIMTLDDLRTEVSAAKPEGDRRITLTPMQGMGLAHAADFATRIPAVEVAAVVEAARAVAFGVMDCDSQGHPLGSSSDAAAPAAAPAHVRACGSWLRANSVADIPEAFLGLAAARQADYGDVDLLISPPPPPPATDGWYGKSSSQQHPTSPEALTAATRAATLECHATLNAVLDGLAAAGFDIEGANTENWRSPTSGRVNAKVGRATLVEKGGTAPWHHLVSPPGGAVRAAGASPGGGAAAPVTPGAPASWMGAIRLPAGHPALADAGGGPRPRRWRRLDVKVYSRAALPTAVAYFTGDGSFNRALRYFAKSSPAARESALAAAGLASGATGWHLSDTHLFPIALPRGRWRAADPQSTRRPVGPAAALACETDIYRALGLSYVPPFCRTFSGRKNASEGR